MAPSLIIILRHYIQVHYFTLWVFIVVVVVVVFATVHFSVIPMINIMAISNCIWNGYWFCHWEEQLMNSLVGLLCSFLFSRLITCLIKAFCFDHKCSHVKYLMSLDFLLKGSIICMKCFR